MAVAALERGVEELVAAFDEPTDALHLFEHTSARLRRLVQFDGSAWFAMDPATLLAVTPVRVENTESGHCESYWDREHQVEDVMLYRDLVRTESGIGTLYTATDDKPARSARYREFLSPQGYGDELRAALRVGELTWGVIDLYRERSRPAFSATDIQVIRAVIPAFAAALRRLAIAGRVEKGAADGPGSVLFDAAGNLMSLDDTAEQLFEELAGPHWATLPYTMTPVYAAVARAIAISEDRERGPAIARVRATTGRWLTVHASRMRGPDGRPGPVAVTIEPARSSQIAPIIVEAYRLTPREQEITRAVARGLSNPEIAAELFLSAHTVRDHLKAIFAKVGVGSRGELVAKLFAEHYRPALHDGTPLVQEVQVD